MSDKHKVHWSKKEDPFQIPIPKSERSTSSPDSEPQRNRTDTPPTPRTESGAAMSLTSKSPEVTQRATNVNSALVLSKVDPPPQCGMEVSHRIYPNLGVTMPNTGNNMGNYMGAGQQYYQQYQPPPANHSFVTNPSSYMPQPEHIPTVGGYGYSAITSQPTRQSSYANAVQANTHHTGGNQVKVASDEDDDARHPQRRPQNTSPATSTGSSDDEDEGQSRPIRSKPSKPATRPTRPKHTSPIVKSIDELAIIGKWEILDEQDEMKKIIEKYVCNSNGVKKSDGTVKIRKIFHLKKKWDLPSFGTEYKMMLWWKTSPEGVKRLAGKKDGCIAFYDRIARAFSVKPGDLKKPFHQIILLCTVTLGEKLNHPQGYQHWNSKVPSRIYNSVKGTGRLKPIWGENETRKSVIIPCGKTEVDRRQRNAELEYNEYMVFEAERIKIKYAVEVEITPKAKGPAPHSDVD